MASRPYGRAAQRRARLPLNTPGMGLLLGALMNRLCIAVGSHYAAVCLYD